MDDTPSERLKAFISYSRDDLVFADQLLEALEAAGIAPVLDRLGISGGEEWKPRLTEMIECTDTVVFALSPRSASSPECQWEVDETLRLRKRLIPIVVKPLEGATVPQALADLNYIFFYHEPRVPGSGFGGGLKRLVTALRLDFSWVREQTRYTDLAQNWHKGSRASHRLMSGDDIGMAKDWLASKPRDIPDPPEIVREFVRESEAAAVSTTRAREEAALQAAAVSRAAANTAEKLSRRTFTGLIVVSLLALVATGIGAVAWVSLQQALKYADRADAATLATQQNLRAMEAEVRQTVAIREQVQTELAEASVKAKIAIERVDKLTAIIDILTRGLRDTEDKLLSASDADERLKERLRELGDPQAMRWLGNLSVQGSQRDKIAALEWYEKAAAEGDAAAMYILGVLNWNGTVVPKDDSRALVWFRKSAAAGHRQALEIVRQQDDQIEMRKRCEDELLTGDKNSMRDRGALCAKAKSFSLAFKWWTKAGAAGDTDSTYYIGMIYANGLGVPKSFADAYDWFNKAATTGNLEAMTSIGVLLANGQGIPRDYVKAREWFEMAAAKGDNLAMVNIGLLHEKGRGVSQNFRRAREWYEKAAAAGQFEAYQRMANLYTHGLGVPQDDDEAHSWEEGASLHLRSPDLFFAPLQLDE